MLVALWTVNALLALAFIGTGTFKLARSKEQLRAAGMAWTDDFDAARIKLAGIAEVLGALGLVLPLATGVAPVLTPVAAVALAGTMVAATAVHLRRRESPAPAVVLLVLSLASAALGFLVLA
ncbi:DoxX family protein [Cellulomonas flavigena DSM 20109]|uniref:DoxX family protein n=1 Tax=Cellulomonas flavigena (strain ATCC 482 / DSM 20109 / BCRC 11376 / JCM 18109 / NBRC 3775 / NCIMB 8073 / NRS 134) TaxID=446466 RepID=D5UGI3_CELFN|nr:DoxX family protein [Cellulomonas flavigena]ADG73166.1 DoxX family protein [Cellulomonas flavigena DSM 20109]